MMNVLTYKGRLPGVMCETRSPAPVSDPLQLDVTGFVGFAERGPLNIPVAIEDISQYELIFGGDLPIAREDGRPVYANLPTTVKSFFDNGGRLAYVVRVADEVHARPNKFLLSGLVTRADDDIQAVVLPATWVGHWSDSMQVGTQLRSQPLAIRDPENTFLIDEDTITLRLFLANLAMLSVGDMLRLHFPAEHPLQLMLRVSEIVAENDGTTPTNNIPVTVQANVESALLLDFTAPESTDMPDSVELLGADGWQETIINEVDSLDPFTLAVDASSTLEEGQLLRLTYGDSQIYFPIDGLNWARHDDDTVYRQVEASEPFQILDDVSSLTDQPTQVDLLSFDVTIREGKQTLETFSERRFGGTSNNWDAVLTNIDPDALHVTLDDFTGSLRLGAGDSSLADQAFPLGMLPLPAFAESLPDSDTSSKDGLDEFEVETLFLDARLSNVGWRTLATQMNQALYLNAERERFTKLHSLWAVPEVALIALPDAVHRPWEDVVPIIDPEPEPPAEPEDHVCEDVFCDCPTDADEEPLPEETIPDWLQFGELDNSADGVRLEDLPELLPADSYTVDALLNVQRNLVRLCAARADMVGILSLPRHFKVREMSEWHQLLRDTNEFLDGNPLSYVATYHGWLQLRETQSPELAPLRNVPSDGVITGMIAARELQRGAWIAPANMDLLGVVATKPAFTDSEWEALYNRQINVIRQQPGRFTMMSSYTLSPDPLYLQVSVRRLLIFLRKLCLREGERYVFETNNTRFRERVQSHFERVLTELMNRGALVAFQVDTSPAVNTQNDYDNGRFIIAIKVAPTNPIEFITITLLRSGEALLQVQER